MNRDPEDDDADDDGTWQPEVIEVAITDELDLHNFAPREVADLVDHYLTLADSRGYPEVRIIHGKGIGNLRRIVHSVLDKHPAVLEYRGGDGHEGGWGATIAVLRRPSGTSQAS